MEKLLISNWLEVKAVGKIALLFPGQGSQQVGMGRDIANRYEWAKAVFAEADEVLGYSLSNLCFAGPKDRLQLTVHAQPAILTTSIALYRGFEQAGLTPHFVAGHSLGEYSALVVAGAISFRDAVVTVHRRGIYMEEAVPAGVGGMSAIIQLERQKLDEVCHQVSRLDYVVQPANYNGPGQVVISGHMEAVHEAGEKAMQAGARRVVPLSVSGPFHSELMKPAAKKLEGTLQRTHIGDARIPVVANVTALPMQNAAEIRHLLVKQMISPVLWEDSIRYMLTQGVSTFVEIGAGNVLSHLVKKIDRQAQTIHVQDLPSLHLALQAFQGSEGDV
jgi:[acyl-carrier-protein] S-malonyltransferase